MVYQLPNGKVIYITIDQYLDLTEEDIQYMMSINHGDHASNPFTNSAITENIKEEYYDFDYLNTDDNDDHEIDITDDQPFDDIIDLSGSLDM